MPEYNPFMKTALRTAVIFLSLAIASINAYAEDARNPSKQLTKEKAAAIRAKIEQLLIAKSEDAEKISNELADAGPESAAFIEAEIISRRSGLLTLILALEKVRERWGLKAPDEPAGIAQAPSPPLSGTEYLRRKFDEAKRMFDKGAYKQASELARAILIMEPSLEFRNEVVQLISRADEQFIQANFLQVTLEIDNTVYETGADVELRVRIANVSDNTIELKAVSDAKAGFGRLSKCVESYGMNGDAAREIAPLPVELGEDIKLEPKKAWVKRLIIPTGYLGAKEPVFRRIIIDGSIRPGSILIAGRETGRIFNFKSVAFSLVPKGYGLLAAQPLLKVREALQDLAQTGGVGKLENDSALRVFLGSCLIEESGREEAIDIILKYLPKADGAEARTLMASLRRLSGVNLPFNADAWQEWYLKRVSEPEKKK
jgi:hypothetical protein